MRHCPACNRKKKNGEFKTLTSYSCLECDAKRRIRVNAYKARNREFVNQITREWRKHNPEKATAAVISWQKRNPERVLTHRRKSHRRRLENNPNYRLAQNTRARIHSVLVGNTKKPGHTAALMGGVASFRKRLEFLWKPGWNWDNYGIIWEIDHIRPLCSFDLTNPAQFKKAFHYSNVQPLSVEENRRKGRTWKGKISCP